MTPHESNADLEAVHITGGGDIVNAICAVMKEVDWIHQTGNTPQYQYLSDTDLALALQGPMQANGLCLLPHKSEVNVTLHREAKGDKAALYRTDLTQTFWLAHKSGTTIPIQVAGCGVDAQDKGIYQAMTGAFKYALRQMFLIPSGEDAERPLTGSELAEESTRLLAALKQVHPKDFKTTLNACFDRLIDGDKKEALALRTAIEKEARAEAQAKKEKE